jgi:hypothetical protein
MLFFIKFRRKHQDKYQNERRSMIKMKVMQKVTGSSTGWRSSSKFFSRHFPLLLVFSLVLVACAQSGRADIPTAVENPQTAPSSTNPGSGQEAGQGNPEGSSPVPTHVDEADAAWVYARCIRENGYPEWPDPNADGQIMLRRDQGMSFNDPRMLAAQEACQDLRPPGMAGSDVDQEEMMEILLQLAQCMRENGVPEWPDPSPDSRGRIVLGPESGINPYSLTFQAAVRTCRANLPGGMMFGGSR